MCDVLVVCVDNCAHACVCVTHARKGFSADGLRDRRYLCDSAQKRAHKREHCQRQRQQRHGEYHYALARARVQICARGYAATRCNNACMEYQKPFKESGSERDIDREATL